MAIIDPYEKSTISTIVDPYETPTEVGPPELPATKMSTDSSPLNWKSPLNAVETAYRGAGNLAEQASKTLVDQVVGTVGKFIAPSQKKHLASFANWLSETDMGKAQVKTVNDVKRLWDSFKTAYPESAENLKAGANIAAVAPIAKMLTPGKMALGSGIDKGLNPIYDQMIDKSIIKNYKKGISPPPAKFKDAHITERYYDDVKTAVRDIVDHVDMPISQAEKPVEAFSIASAETKSKLWKAATEISKDAPVTISLEPAIKAMENMKQNHNLIRARPEVIEYLNKKITDFRSVPTEIVPQEAEGLLSIVNSDARNFWKAPQGDNRAYAAEYIAQHIRKGLYTKMESLGGDKYANFRKRYGAQLTIEADVAKREAQLAGRKDYGFWDLSNIVTSVELVDALINPISLGKAAAIQGVKAWMKTANDPNKMIRKMFSDVERYKTLKYKSLNTFSEKPPINPTNSQKDYPKFGIPGVTPQTEGQAIRSNRIQEMIRGTHELPAQPPGQNKHLQYGQIVERTPEQIANSERLQQVLRSTRSTPAQPSGSSNPIPYGPRVTMTPEQIAEARRIDELIRLRHEQNKMISF